MSKAIRPFRKNPADSGVCENDVKIDVEYERFDRPPSKHKRPASAVSIVNYKGKDHRVHILTYHCTYTCIIVIYMYRPMYSDYYDVSGL